MKQSLALKRGMARGLFVCGQDVVVRDNCSCRMVQKAASVVLTCGSDETAQMSVPVF